jgi:RNA polymerase sigma-70 factor (ECF subfamily)
VNIDKYKHTSDQELLENFYTTHEVEWLGYCSPLYPAASGRLHEISENEEEAKDCVQQIFLKVITELNKYRVEYFKSWLYMVAKNHCLMKIRDSHRKIPRGIN